MSAPRRTFISRLQTLAGFVDGVRECAAAGQARRTPSRRSLRALGLDPESFHEGR